MKSVKRITQLLSATLLVMLVILNGCGKDNPVAPVEGPIEGIWNLVKVCSETGGQSYCVPDDEIDADPLAYEFSADGTGGMWYQGSEVDFTWVRDGSSLTMTTAGQAQGYTCSVTTSKLTLTFPIDIYTITHTFDRQ